MTEKQKFVILTAERTGSNYLCDLLDAVPSVRCHKEIFHPDAIYWNKGVLATADAIAKRNHNPTGFVDGVLNSAQHRWIGFKLFLYHNDAALRYVVSSSDIKKIVLCRDNALAQYSSQKIATLTSQWTLPQAKLNERKELKIIWDEADFLVYRKRQAYMFDAVRALLQETGQGYMDLEYRSLFGRSYKDLLSFLGLPVNQERVEGRLQKQNTSVVVDRFQDSDSVLKYLRKIGKEEWAEEKLE